MRKKIYMLIIVVLFFTSFTWAQESSLTITDRKTNPTIVNPGGKVLISCKVSHSEDPVFIGRVAATVYYDKWTTAYSMLYDDGTHGDIESDDGHFSLEIIAGKNPGMAQVIFHALDNNGHEIDSNPISFTIQ